MVSELKLREWGRFMKLNKMTSAAVRIVGRLYLQGELMTTKKIAEQEKISLGVAMKLVGYLREAGIIESGLGRGGRSGGFKIASDLRDVTLYDIFMAVEGEIALYPESEKEYYEDYLSGFYREFERTSNRLTEEMKRVSIYDIFHQKETEKTD